MAEIFKFMQIYANFLQEHGMENSQQSDAAVETIADFFLSRKYNF